MKQTGICLHIFKTHPHSITRSCLLYILLSAPEIEISKRIAYKRCITPQGKCKGKKVGCNFQFAIVVQIYTFSPEVAKRCVL